MRTLPKAVLLQLQFAPPHPLCAFLLRFCGMSLNNAHPSTLVRGRGRGRCRIALQVILVVRGSSASSSCETVSGRSGRTPALTSQDGKRIKGPQLVRVCSLEMLR